MAHQINRTSGLGEWVLTCERWYDWVKKVEVDAGQRCGITTEPAEKMKALEREVRELKQASEILRKASAYFTPLSANFPFACRVTHDLAVAVLRWLHKNLLVHLRENSTVTRRNFFGDYTLPTRYLPPRNL